MTTEHKNAAVRELAKEATDAIASLQRQGLYDTDRWIGDRLHPAAVLGLLIYIDELEECIDEEDKAGGAMTARASTNAERQALRERAISVLHSRSVRRAWEWFQAAATPEAILDLLNCIEELGERTGEKDPEDDS